MGSLPFLQCTGETSKPGLPGNPGFVAISLVVLPCIASLPQPSWPPLLQDTEDTFDDAKPRSEQENENY